MFEADYHVRNLPRLSYYCFANPGVARQPFISPNQRLAAEYHTIGLDTRSAILNKNKIGVDCKPMHVRDLALPLEDLTFAHETIVHACPPSVTYSSELSDAEAEEYLSEDTSSDCSGDSEFHNRPRVAPRFLASTIQVPVVSHPENTLTKISFPKKKLKPGRRECKNKPSPCTTIASYVAAARKHTHVKSLADYNPAAIYRGLAQFKIDANDRPHISFDLFREAVHSLPYASMFQPYRSQLCKAMLSFIDTHPISVIYSKFHLLRVIPTFKVFLREVGPVRNDILSRNLCKVEPLDDVFKNLWDAYRKHPIVCAAREVQFFASRLLPSLIKKNAHRDLPIVAFMRLYSKAITEYIEEHTPQLMDTTLIVESRHRIRRRNEVIADIKRSLDIPPEELIPFYQELAGRYSAADLMEEARKLFGVRDLYELLEACTRTVEVTFPSASSQNGFVDAFTKFVSDAHVIGSFAMILIAIICFAVGSKAKGNVRTSLMCIGVAAISISSYKIIEQLADYFMLPEHQIADSTYKNLAGLIPSVVQWFKSQMPFGTPASTVDVELSDIQDWGEDKPESYDQHTLMQWLPSDKFRDALS